MPPEVITAQGGEDEEEALVHTMVRAFAADPLARWYWPDRNDYDEFMPELVQALGGAAFESDGAHCTADRGGVALWLRPGARPDTLSLLMLFEETLPGELLGEVFGVLEKMAEYRPRVPHWYLPLIGVVPELRGQGYGSALLRYALQECDREGSVAYLESSNPRNIAFYERHGFRKEGELQVGTSPTLTAMLREPR